MEKGTITIFSANHLPNVGGIEWYSHNLARALVQMGHRVIIVTNNVFGLDTLETDENGAEILRLPCKNALGGRYPLPKKNAEYKRLMEWLSAQGVDYVSVNTRFYPHSLTGIRFAEEQGIKPILVDHGSAHLTMGSAVIDVGVRAVEHFMTMLVKKHEIDFYAVSGAGVEWLKHFGIEAKGVLNNSIDAQAFRQSSSDRDFRSELSVSLDTFVVSFTGRFIPEKGVLAIQEAAVELREKKIAFFLAGEGPLKEKLEEASLENVFLLGKLSSPDVSALLQQSDAFCLPSRSEGFSSSLLEAAACGRAPIITNVGGVSELMPTDEYGVILKQGDGGEIAEAVEYLRFHADVCKKMGAKIQTRVEEYFSWNSTADLTIQACADANAQKKDK